MNLLRNQRYQPYTVKPSTKSSKAMSPLETLEQLISVTKRILVIDDEPDLRIVVRSCLEDLAGWEVITAESGVEGFEKAVADAPDAIVLDLMMPNIDGLSVLQSLKTNVVTQSIPIVLLTASTRKFTPQRLAEMGVCGVIAKPFDPMALPRRIAALVGWNGDDPD